MIWNKLIKKITLMIVSGAAGLLLTTASTAPAPAQTINSATQITTVPSTKGGLGIDTSASSGCPQATSGVWTVASGNCSTTPTAPQFRLAAYNGSGSGSNFALQFFNATTDSSGDNMYIPGAVNAVNGVFSSLNPGNCIQASTGGALTDTGLPCGTGSPGGSNLQLQFNDSSIFGGASGITTDGTHANLSISNHVGYSGLSGHGTNCTNEDGGPAPNCDFRTWFLDTELISSGLEGELMPCTHALAGGYATGGWSTVSCHTELDTFTAPGIHEIFGTGGNHIQDYVPGDFALDYWRVGHNCARIAPDDEACQGSNITLLEESYFQATVASHNDSTGVSGYPSGAHVVTFAFNQTGSVNHPTASEWMYATPATSGIGLACQFNGDSASFNGSPLITTTPITGGCTPPAVFAWGTLATGTWGTLATRSINVPAQSTATFTLGSGSPSFESPGGANAWDNYVCVAGFSSGIGLENSRLISASGAGNATLVANLRYAYTAFSGNPIYVFQGPGCAPYMAVSFDQDLAEGAPSSYISPGTIGGQLIVLNVFPLGVSEDDRPETSTSNFHLQPATMVTESFIVGQFGAGSLGGQIEDNNSLAVLVDGTPIIDAHGEEISTYGYTIGDITTNYRNSSAKSNGFRYNCQGVGCSSAVQAFMAQNSQPLSYYQGFGGTRAAPDVFGIYGAWDSILHLDDAPIADVITVDNFLAGQTSMGLIGTPVGQLAASSAGGNTWTLSQASFSLPNGGISAGGIISGTGLYGSNGDDGLTIVTTGFTTNGAPATFIGAGSGPFGKCTYIDMNDTKDPSTMNGVYSCNDALADGSITLSETAPRAISLQVAGAEYVNISNGLLAISETRTMFGPGGWAYSGSPSVGSTGDAIYNNGVTDSSGSLFYYGNNTNFGIDTAPIAYKACTGQTFRFIHNLDESGGVILGCFDSFGDFSVAGNTELAGNLVIDGTCTGCGGVTIPGSNSQVFFNSSGTLAADPDFTTDGAGNVTVTSLKASGLTLNDFVTAGTGGQLTSNGHMADNGIAIQTGVPFVANSLSGTNAVELGGFNASLNSLLSISVASSQAAFYSSGASASTIGTYLFNGYTPTGPVTDLFLSLTTTAATFSHPVVDNNSGGPGFAANLFTPSSSSATCTTGQVSWDTGFIYVCTATNTWQRAVLATF